MEGDQGQKTSGGHLAPSTRVVRVAKQLALPTYNHGVSGSNSAGGEISSEPKRRFIAQNPSCSPFHRPDITEVLLLSPKPSIPLSTVHAFLTNKGRISNENVNIFFLESYILSSLIIRNILVMELKASLGKIPQVYKQSNQTFSFQIYSSSLRPVDESKVSGYLRKIGLRLQA